MAKKGMGVFIFMAILIFIAIFPINASTLPYGKIIFVDDDFTNDPANHKWNSIQAAIDDAEEGDIIFIFAGMYEENIFVDKGIKIIGENAESVIIDGNERLYAFNIIANNVFIENLTIINGLEAGIFTDCNNVSIKNCIIYGNDLYGMELHGNNISIENITIYDVPVGIKVSSKNISLSNIKIYNTDWGLIFEKAENCTVQGSFYDIENKSIWVCSATNITISNSTIYDSFCGVWLYNTTNSTIISCNISNNKIGVKLQDSNSNEIINTNLMNNFGYGLYSENSFNNTIHHNNFIGNGINAYDEGMNKWNSSVGNYWDDYVGYDANEDGLGDEPYEIGNIIDYCPLVYPISVPPAFIWVDDDFDTSTPGWGVDHFNDLSKAIDALATGGKCYVYPGLYGNVEIGKSLQIVGDSAIIRGGEEGIFIKAGNVGIKGLVIEASRNAIKIQNVENVSISDCIARSNTFGLYVIDAENCTIYHCNFTNNVKGIYFVNVSSSKVYSCNIENNTYFGIELSHSSSNNEIFSCNIKNNGNYGIYIAMASSGNEIYHNNFINNSAFDNCNNDWNGEYEMALGNYWSDFNSIDKNKDGIYDTPYYIDGGAIDAYPLVNEIKNPPIFVWINKKYNATTPGWGIDHFNSINDGIEKLQIGGGCYIFGGIYKESLEINKEICIAGENAILEGDNGMKILADSVEVYNLEIRNCWNGAGIEIIGNNASISLCRVYNCYYGLFIKGDNVTVNASKIYRNTYAGILMRYSWNSSIVKNEIFENNNGIILQYSGNNSIEYNNISNNFVNGLKMEQSQGNEIYHNIFENNFYGVYTDASDNLIHFNDFIGNEKHAYDEGMNKWNSSVGNYWDDYVGYDANEDGLGDEPYEIKVGRKDYHPLIRRAGLPIAYFHFHPSQPYTYEIVYFYDNSIDLDGYITQWIWDFGDGSIGYGKNVTHEYVDNGIYTINLTVIDNDGGIAYAEKQIEVLNREPVANFTWMPADPTDVEKVLFNASLSYDTDGYVANYTWDFGDGSIGYGKNVNHSYSDDGTYTVVLTIKDDDGAMATISKTIEVRNVAPIANFYYTPSQPYTYEIVYFYDNSIDLDGYITQWIWDFGDGSIGYGKNVTHEYVDNGIYTINLTVIDNDGGIAYAEKQIEVLNREPVANFTWMPADPTDVEKVLFNASLSYDTDGYVANYTWDFGDGSIGYGKNVNHSYSDDGTYTVVLTIKDDDGAMATISKTIEVRNVAPIANFYYTPSQPTDLDTVIFEDKSVDADGYIVNYTWYFGDGYLGYGKKVKHNYTNNGVYKVTLTVKDDDGAVATISKYIEIRNIPPVANFSWKPEKPTDLQSIDFISNCSDADGFIVNYTWNFGNGNYSYGKNVTYKYADNGIYTVKLVVYDDDGAKAEVEKQIEVLNVEPTALFKIDPSKPRENEKVTFDASLSYDADGSIVNYTWDFNSDGIADAYGMEVIYKFDKKGKYLVTLTVIDNDGAKDNYQILVDVKEKERVPGFEFIIIIVASAILVFMKRYRKGIWRI